MPEGDIVGGGVGVTLEQILVISNILFWTQGEEGEGSSASLSCSSRSDMPMPPHQADRKRAPRPGTAIHSLAHQLRRQTGLPAGPLHEYVQLLQTSQTIAYLLIGKETLATAGTTKAHHQKAQTVIGAAAQMC